VKPSTLIVPFLLGVLVARGASGAEVSSDSNSIPVGTNLSEIILQPLPPPVQTPNLVPLSPGEQLGKDVFFDHTLSKPEGYACATCHIPQSGFTGPSSLVNIVAGPVPGVVPGRVGRRKPQAISYATFSPWGPYLSGGLEGGTYLGGAFWDGRAPDTATQARMPLLDQNEMANTPAGLYPPHAGGYSPLVARKLQHRPYTPLFKRVFGTDVFRTSTDHEIYNLLTSALALYEASAEVNPFSSKFDASTNGTPAMTHYIFTRAEERGRRLFFGKAQCSQCHSSATLDPVSQATQGKETFTMYCYANIGVPRNPGNPYYGLTNCDSDPEGCNPLGPDFIDYGLGANPNPAPDGTVFMNTVPGDIAQFRGLFKAPSLRNVNLRPYPGFVKSYMHNGVFKSLEEVVHFYNKRNIATNAAGEEMAFNSLGGPPDGYTPIFPPPEVLDNLQNSAGYTPAQATQIFPPSDPPPSEALPVGLNGQVGNLELSAREEADLVSFLKTLSDGYTTPNGVKRDSLTLAVTPPAAASVVLQLAAQAGHSYILLASTNLRDWSPLSTNILTQSVVNVTNVMAPGAPAQFWKAVSAPLP
jgi:cytochrome c peroxidase